MKSLTEYLLKENMNINDLHTSVINYLNNMVKNNDKENIQRIYNICNTVNNSLELNDFLSKTGLSEENMDLIIRLIEKYDTSEEVINRFNNPIDFNSLPLNGNIFDMIDKTHLNFWKSISKLRPEERGKDIGMYEILLILILRNAQKGIKGDIIIDKCYNIEIKSSGARCTPGGFIKSPYFVNFKLNELLNESLNVEGKEHPLIKDADITRKETIVNNTFKNYGDIITNEMIGISMLESWVDVLNDKYDAVKYEWLKFIEDINIHKSPGQTIKKLYAILSIYCYKYTDNWNALMIFNKKNSNYIIIDDRNLEFKKLFKLFDDDKLKAISLPSIDSRSYVPQIDCK